MGRNNLAGAWGEVLAAEYLRKKKYALVAAGYRCRLGEIDLIVVPAVAFDKTGLRLGRGGGYYDKFLKKHARAMLIGVGYDFQLVDQVPAERHDQKVHRIILPSQTIVV